jgi:hypothetical protein
MNFQQEFSETQNFHPEYLPEPVTPFFINKTTLAGFTKKSWIGRFLTLPRVSAFVLDSLEKSNDFTLDLHQAVKQLEGKVERMNEKFSALDGLQGDFRTLNEKFRKIESNERELQRLSQAALRLEKRAKLMWILILVSVLTNLGMIYYTFLPQ